MRSSHSPEGSTASTEAFDRFVRLRETATFRGEALERWRGSRLLVVGGGNLGSRLAPEAVRSGASVSICDPDRGSVENLGTQGVVAGVDKASSVVAACDAIAPGRADGLATDVRHVGVDLIREFDAIFDCTDDPNLALALTEISNGLSVPLLRLALDGSGKSEWGRVLASHGGAGHACQLCSYTVNDIRAHLPRVPCPHRAAASPRPTLAGGALGMAIAGLGLLQAQRLLGGNGRELVLDREVILDLDNFETHSIELTRSADCLSGHGRWELGALDVAASETTFRDLFEAARRELGVSEVILEPYLHPLCAGASCVCGTAQAAVGTVWAVPPRCPDCRRPMAWRRDLRWHRLLETHSLALGIHDVSLLDLGLPERGAMVGARTTGGARWRFLLR